MFEKQIQNYENRKELKRINKLVRDTETLAQKLENLSLEELRQKTNELKERIQNGASLDSLLPEAYAIVINADRLVLGMTPFHCQIQGAIILHQGKLAEMKTGEGKTLVETMPAYLNALEGEGVHIITVNDYLAKRDGTKMGQVFQALGLTVGIIQHDMEPEDRKKAYQCDITYVTNNEAGFDYLRDNICTFKSQIVQRKLHYCIIDEADSVLIDEARTPLILSGKSDEKNELYEKCASFAKTLTRGGQIRKLKTIDMIKGDSHVETGDFETDEKTKEIVLTEQGIAKAEQYFKIDNLGAPDNFLIYHGIFNALRAEYVLKRDEDYIIKDGKVYIVDEYTGRILPGRRYSDGLHQAVEAKEGLKTGEENITMASITFQSFFNLYDKKCGMSGTAYSEKEELLEIYQLPVVIIPTNKPVIRKDYPDVIYQTEKEKLDRILWEVQESAKKRQPVLIGTASIRSSEQVSDVLTQAGIQHAVLNAKNNEKEAGIIAKAGQKGAVTVATNMAGRGTDIILDDEAKAAGGLKVIGTERHESRRIDDQLRGRAGRQGDPGESVFLLSLEDDLIKRFAAAKLKTLYKTLGKGEHEPIKGKAVSGIVEYAQKNVEADNFEQRKKTAKYDAIINMQRQFIYRQRKEILLGKSIHEQIAVMAGELIKNITAKQQEEGNEDAASAVNEKLGTHFTQAEIPKDLDKAYEFGRQRYLTLCQNAAEGMSVVEELERICMLKAIDVHWMNAEEEEEFQKTCTWQDTMAQKNPEVEFGLRSRRIFDDMNDFIRQDTVRMMFYLLQDSGNAINLILAENGFIGQDKKAV